MVVGFTGTREGMSRMQLERVTQIVNELRPTEVHHGCCVGADAQFHGAMLDDYSIIGHPGPDGPLRFVDYSFRFITLHPAKDYGARNQDIIDACDVLVAAPKEMAEAQRGGTWQTVRKARKAHKRVIIVWPDGRST